MIEELIELCKDRLILDKDFEYEKIVKGPFKNSEVIEYYSYGVYFCKNRYNLQFCIGNRFISIELMDEYKPGYINQVYKRIINLDCYEDVNKVMEVIEEELLLIEIEKEIIGNPMIKKIMREYKINQILSS